MKALRLIGRHKYITSIVCLSIIGIGSVVAISRVPTQPLSSTNTSSNTSKVSSNSPSSIKVPAVGSNTAAQDEAQAQADENQANQDAQNAQSISQQQQADENNASALESELQQEEQTPSVASSTSINTPNCSAYDSQIGSINQELIVDEEKLADAQQQAEDEGNYSGATASQENNAYEQIVESDEAAIQSIEQQQSALNTEYPQC